MLLLATFFPASETGDAEPNDDIVTVSQILHTCTYKYKYIRMYKHIYRIAGF